MLGIRSLTVYVLGMFAILEVTKASVCQDPLGMEDGRIADSQITGSSQVPTSRYNSYHGVHNARLNRPSQTGTTGAWSTENNDPNPWIQADLLRPTWVTGVTIQGRQDCCAQWVTMFKVQYSNDGEYWKYVQTANNQGEQIFVGNTDANTAVTRLFATPVQATFIRIRPTAWNNHVSMRFEVLGCEADICQDLLGMEDGRIADSQISASTEFAHAVYHGAHNARLNRLAQTGTTGSWSSQTNDINQWIEVNLGASTWVTGALIQGRADLAQWVTKFKVQYSDDGEYWKYVQTASNQVEQILDGSTDKNRAVVALFNSPVRASFVRIRPTVWQGHISMRFELLGC